MVGNLRSAMWKEISWKSEEGCSQKGTPHYWRRRDWATDKKERKRGWAVCYQPILCTLITVKDFINVLGCVWGCISETSMSECIFCKLLTNNDLINSHVQAKLTLSTRLSHFILRETWISAKFSGNLSNSFTESHTCEPHGGATGKVRGSPKSWDSSTGDHECLHKISSMQQLLTYFSLDQSGGPTVDRLYTNSECDQWYKLMLLLFIRKCSNYRNQCRTYTEDKALIVDQLKYKVPFQNKTTRPEKVPLSTKSEHGDSRWGLQWVSL